MPNGAYASGAGSLQFKSLPISINHLASGTVTVNDLTNTANNVVLQKPGGEQWWDKSLSMVPRAALNAN